MKVIFSYAGPKKDYIMTQLEREYIMGNGKQNFIVLTILVNVLRKENEKGVIIWVQK